MNTPTKNKGIAVQEIESALHTARNAEHIGFPSTTEELTAFVETVNQMQIPPPDIHKFRQFLLQHTGTSGSAHNESVRTTSLQTQIPNPSQVINASPSRATKEWRGLVKKVERLTQAHERFRRSSRIRFQKQESTFKGQIETVRKQQEHKIEEIGLNAERVVAICTQLVHEMGHLNRNLHRLIAASNYQPHTAVVGTFVARCDSILRALSSWYGQQYKFRVAVDAFVSNGQLVTVATDTLSHPGRTSDGTRSKPWALNKNPRYSDIVLNMRTFAEAKNAVVASIMDDLKQSPSMPHRAGFLSVDCVSRNARDGIFIHGSAFGKYLHSVMLGFADEMFSFLATDTQSIKVTAGNDACFVTNMRDFRRVKRLQEVYLAQSWLKIKPVPDPSIATN